MCMKKLSHIEQILLLLVVGFFISVQPASAEQSFTSMSLNLDSTSGILTGTSSFPFAIPYYAPSGGDYTAIAISDVDNLSSWYDATGCPLEAVGSVEDRVAYYNNGSGSGNGSFTSDDSLLSYFVGGHIYAFYALGLSTGCSVTESGYKIYAISTWLYDATTSSFINPVVPSDESTKFIQITPAQHTVISSSSSSTALGVDFQVSAADNVGAVSGGVTLGDRVTYDLYEPVGCAWWNLVCSLTSTIYTHYEFDIPTTTIDSFYGFDWLVNDSQDITKTGNYAVQVAIQRPVGYFDGVAFNYQTIVSTSTMFTVGSPSSYDNIASSTVGVIGSWVSGAANTGNPCFFDVSQPTQWLQYIATCSVSFLVPPQGFDVSPYTDMADTLGQKFPFSYFTQIVYAYQALQVSSTTQESIAMNLHDLNIASTTTNGLGNILPNLVVFSPATVQQYAPSGFFDTLKSLAAAALVLTLMADIFFTLKGLMTTL